MGGLGLKYPIHVTYTPRLCARIRAGYGCRSQTTTTAGLAVFFCLAMSAAAAFSLANINNQYEAI
jgi:hypothetical protein